MTANVLNVVNKVIFHGNAPRVVPINVSDARKKAILGKTIYPISKPCIENCSGRGRSPKVG